MTALITGAGAESEAPGDRLHPAGIRVGLLGRSQGELDLTKLEIEHAGGIAHRFRADVRDFEQFSAAVDRMTEIYGAVHVLIANAAVLPIGPFVEHGPRDWKEVFETNVIGVMNACRTVLPR